MSGLPTTDVEYEPAAPPRRRTPWLWMLGFALLVVAPVIAVNYHAEVSRWKVAAALEAWERGDATGGEQLLQEALRWDPQNPQVPLVRAQRLADNKDYAGALEMLEKASEHGATVSTFVLAEFLTKAGRAKEAVALFDPAIRALRVADSETVFEFLHKAYRGNLASLLNMQAYLRAVGNFELEAALEQIEEALSYSPDKRSRTALLDTRGFIRWRKGEYAEALADLNVSVEQAEQELKEALSPKAGVGRKSVTPADLRHEKEQLTKPVAVIRYHRALIHQSLGDEAQAEKDFARVRELGFEPGDDLF
jgi:tetratricopeptide (TPR) repeat protein